MSPIIQPGLSLSQASGLFEPQIKGLLYPIGSGSPLVSAVNSFSAAGAIYGCRVIAPYGGSLRNVSAYIGATAGNVVLGATDTGDANAGQRTVLWVGSIAAVHGWVTIDPGAGAVPVYEQQQLDLFIQGSTVTTLTFGGSSEIQAPAGELPAALLTPPGGASPRLNWTTTSFAYNTLAAGNQIPEADLANTSPVPILLAQTI